MGGFESLFARGRTQAYEDTDFVQGDSPRILDVNTDLGNTDKGKNGHFGFIINDGPGSITVEISDDGTNYGSKHTVQDGDIWSLDFLDIDRIRLTWIADSAYRIRVV